jgi:predicted TIM-barrel fold metal-dependent hydrolase
MIVDSHVHVVDPARFSFAADAAYRPGPAEWGDAAALAAEMTRRGVGYAVLVQPSFYGTDNAALLDALDRMAGRGRGIATVDPSVADDALDRLAGAGVVGIRLNLVSADPRAAEAPGIDGLLRRVARRGWFVEVYALADAWPPILPALERSGVRVLIDHFGHPDLTRDPVQPGFARLLAYARANAAIVKFSAPFRVTGAPCGYERLDPFVGAIVDAVGVERCVWGSDWPFVNFPARVGYDDLRGCVDRWFDDESDRRRVLSDNPLRVFGFEGRA